VTDLTVSNRLADDYLATAMRADVLAGLTADPKRLRPVWFYDARGSELFEEITRLPEYYPTRAEREILAVRAAEIAAATGARTLIELGSGSSEKTRLLLTALRQAGTLRQYVPVDVSATALQGAAEALDADYADLVVSGVVADFTAHLDALPGEGPRLVAFLGSTIGNFEPGERASFLADIAALLDPGDSLLLGTDLVKDPGVLLPAYDDPTGVTAEFNRNVLHVLNRELGADFDPTGFEHVVAWDPAQEWVEMRLRSVREQTVKIGELRLVVDFAEGEEMRTEVSAKFRRAGVAAELAAAGLEQRAWWTDEAGRFALSLAVPAEPVASIETEAN
jgi:L-histidine N-alpha-methyltransferase